MDLGVHPQQRVGVYGEIAQPTGVADGELLQARAPRRGHGVAERAGAVEPDAAKVDPGEPGEDAGGWHGEAVEPQDERDRGGLLEAGELKGASLRGLLLLLGISSPGQS
jgi:hypothetical protein